MTAPAIHLNASVSASAKLASGLKVGAFAVVGAGVELGEDCVLHPHAVVYGPSKFGAANVFHPFCVVGGDPQDYTFAGEHTQLIAGDKNVFREYVTVSRGTIKGGGVTRMGNDNFLLAYTHIGHDCQIGSNNLFVNAATLAGHVTRRLRDDWSTVAGPSILPDGMLMWGPRITQDVPPFSVLSPNGRPDLRRESLV
jgi:UDP-N-acetylglucosamine acyltransferase